MQYENKVKPNDSNRAHLLFLQNFKLKKKYY
jgi:hypothetical protein